MTIDPSLIVIALCSLIPSVIGALVMRSVKGMDKSIEALTEKVDTLSKQDTTILVELAGLRVRVAHLEHLMMGRGMIPDSDRQP